MSTSSTSASTLVRDAEPFTPEQTREITERFDRDGYALLPGILTPEEVAALVERVEAAFADPRWEQTNNRYGEIVLTRMFEMDRMFRDLLVREPLISLAEAILGESCHLMAQNCVMNPPGQAIDTFHVDDVLIFPVAEGMERHDPRLRMPIHVFTYQILLTDVPSHEYGPTQFVPGSHYSGRQPDDPKNPTFEGRGPVDILGKAGDVYLHNGQCWHRGAPNNSDRTRILLQHAMSRRWVSQRFYPFVNYQFPEGVLDGANERLKRVLGFHGKGAYG